MQTDGQAENRADGADTQAEADGSRRGGATPLRLSGRLDGRTSAAVRSALYEHVERDRGQRVVIDLSRVEFIDSTCLRVLAAFAVRLQRAGRHVVLRGCSPALRRLLAFTGVRRLFWFERREDA